MHFKRTVHKDNFNALQKDKAMEKYPSDYSNHANCDL